ncbi:hypothetical protein D3C76_1227540 [compost metagenome]
MQPKAFHIDHFQPGFTDACHHHRQMRQLTIGKYITPDKLTGAPANRSAINMFGGNSVIHYQPALPHCREQALAVQLQVGMTHMFEHANTDHLVKATILGQFTIIEQLQFYLAFQAICLDSLTPQFQLLLAQRYAHYLCAKIPCGIARQPSPATADVQQVIASVQS